MGHMALIGLNDTQLKWTLLPICG